VGGPQRSTWPQSHSLPSLPRSHQRPPIRGSTTTAAIGDFVGFIEWVGSHQRLMSAVKTSNARRGGIHADRLQDGLDVRSRIGAVHKSAAISPIDTGPPRNRSNTARRVGSASAVIALP